MKASDEIEIGALYKHLSGLAQYRVSGRVLRCQGVDGGELLQRRADAKGAVDLGVGHGGADFRQPGGQFRESEVAVGVDEHGSARPGRPRERGKLQKL